jgi:hypothetical protein
MDMAAPRNNQNARKWTEARVLGYLAEIERLATDRRQLFLGRVLAELGLHKNVWAYWQHIFTDNEGLLYKMDLIKDRFEAHLYLAALKSEVPAAFAIMCLKANYGWREDHSAEKIQLATEMDITDEKHIEQLEWGRAA